MARVLIVDDEPGIRVLLHMALAEYGHDCEEAADGSEALTRLSSSNYDLVLLDLAMPAVGGLEVLEALDSGQVDRPVVAVITAQKTAEAHEKAMALGCSLFVTKPFEPRHLVRRLERLLESA